ncbi:hypothetical protein I6F37_39575, partial [Bradyrhizobium sp. NBAIM08]|nr:hypothetical protein [Bradyrhizobium sp. NBAIM08]
HQKLIEESPAPNLPQKVREELCKAAVRLAQTAGYYNAGTCEFIVDQDNNYYFIEVNARIQVEHPVTELVTGVDLVEAQLAIAEGRRLTGRQTEGATDSADRMTSRGHAIEVRLYAEDAAYVPQSGGLVTFDLQADGGFELLGRHGVRVD